MNSRHDLTTLQRQEKNKVVAKAKEEEEKERSGNYVYRVRGHPGKWRVAKVDKRTNKEVKESKG